MRRYVVACWVCLVLLFTPGCGSCDPKSPAPTSGVAEEPLCDVQMLTSVETSCPAFAVDEYELPAMCTLEGYDTRYAIAHDANFDGHGANRLRLLDMDSGRHDIVVPAARGHEEGFNILGAACSDRWIAWEELTGDEQADPLSVSWRLYAAPIVAGEEPRVGDAQLVTESIVSVRSRPLLQVVGDRLYRMTNTFPNAQQEGATWRSSVIERDLVSGIEREVYTGLRMIHTYCVQGDDLVLAEYADRETRRCVVRVLGLKDAAEHFEFDLENEFEVSHWPAYHDGVLLWSASPGDAAPYPRLCMRDANGLISIVALEGGDACFVGSYVLYESWERDTLGASQRLARPTLNGLDVASLRHFTMLQTTGVLDDAEWRMSPGQPYRESVFVVAACGLSAGERGEGGMLVRRYRIE